MRVRDVLLGAQAAVRTLPVCDHYCGVESRMRKSLRLQTDDIERHGVCRFDVTLDCEDGAPAGQEAEQARLVAALLQDLPRDLPASARVGVRVHAVDHSAFADDVARILGEAGPVMSHFMIPKAESVADIEKARRAIDAAGGQGVPLQALIESPAAVHQAFEIAAHPRVESLSFGLMDFVSTHNGAIPFEAMGAQGQFEHPLVQRAKLDIASACHAHGKVPSHCVVTEFRDVAALQAAARRAARTLGYIRMWSIHPDQIAPILAAFTPEADEVELALRVLQSAQAADWGPVSVGGRLHDRASYRYFWFLLERARAQGVALPTEALAWWAEPVPSPSLSTNPHLSTTAEPQHVH